MGTPDFPCTASQLSGYKVGDRIVICRVIPDDMTNVGVTMQGEVVYGLIQYAYAMLLVTEVAPSEHDITLPMDDLSKLHGSLIKHEKA